MEKIKWFEPVPNRFYCPRSLYEDWASEANGFPGTWLGETIASPGGSYTYQVQSGPCCRIYTGNGYAEAHAFERGWKPKDEVAYARDPIGYGADGRNWTRVGANYLSYEVTIIGGSGTVSYQTVRWESPIHKNVDVAKVCTLVCPLKHPLYTKQDDLNKTEAIDAAA